MQRNRERVGRKKEERKGNYIEIERGRRERGKRERERKEGEEARKKGQNLAFNCFNALKMDFKN